jgi:hypothetical protein
MHCVQRSISINISLTLLRASSCIVCTGSVTIFPEEAYRNAYVDALAYSTAMFDEAVRAASAMGAGSGLPVGGSAGEYLLYS